MRRNYNCSMFVGSMGGWGCDLTCIRLGRPHGKKSELTVASNLTSKHEESHKDSRITCAMVKVVTILGINETSHL